MVVSELSHVMINPRNQMPTVHSHHNHELYHLISGNATFYIGDRIFYAEAGNFVFIPQGIFHRSEYGDQTDIERIVMNFSDTVFTDELWPVREELCRQRIIYVAKNKISYLNRLLHQIQEELNCADGYKDYMVRLYISELLIQLCRHKYDYQPAHSNTDNTMHQISQYISSHYSEPLPLETLCRQFCISKSHLSRKFKEYAGIGLNEYITYVRITNAERLLKESTLSLTQVSEQCGFADSNYFSTVFKKITGISPYKYSKREATDGS